MSAFDEREKAFEAKYHLDEELAFKVNARRDKLLGLWVADKLGLKGDEAEAYARSVLETDMIDAAHATMLAKLHADLAAKEADVSVERLRHKMDKFYSEAYAQIVTDVAHGTLDVSPE
ncbi:hypothetical protein GALL_229410 [mine drainage metagenome]|uniref:DUF1476 domain-containing protein n=1 Tax=mine drainage metagenome TaxID=410659 RepID=A0A1J5S461_9ZZZZ